MAEKTKIQLSDAELVAAAEDQRDRDRRMGKGDDGDFFILEMDQRTGAQTLISAPNLNVPISNAGGVQEKDPDTGEPLYQWQALTFANQALAASWVAERGEKGFSYMILKGVAAAQGTRSEEELADLVEQDAESMRAAVTEDQQERKE